MQIPQAWAGAEMKLHVIARDTYHVNRKCHDTKQYLVVRGKQ
jgi:hypothetical protein